MCSVNKFQFCSSRVLLDAITASPDDEKKLPRCLGCRPVMCVGATFPIHSSLKINHEALSKFTSTTVMTSPPAAPAFALFTLMVPTPPRIFNTFWLHFYELAGRKTQTENIFIGVFTFFFFRVPGKSFHSIVYNFAQAWLGRQARFRCAWPRQERRTILSANAPGNHEIKQNS